MSIRSPKARYGMQALRSSQEQQAKRLSVPKRSVDKKDKVISMSTLGHRKGTQMVIKDDDGGVNGDLLRQRGAETQLSTPMNRKSSLEALRLKDSPQLGLSP